MGLDYPEIGWDETILATGSVSLLSSSAERLRERDRSTDASKNLAALPLGTAGSLGDGASVECPL